jgi:hypothetical protein
MSNHFGYLWREARVGNDRGPSMAARNNPFAEWTYGPRKVFSNCYGFAANAFHDDELHRVLLQDPSEIYRVHVAWPGTTGGRPFQIMTPDSIKDALIADGFIALPYSDQIQIPEGSYLIACYCESSNSQDNDYHFYRYLEKDGSWYHKHWFMDPQNTDRSDQVIRKIENADRGDYNVLVGIFASPQDRHPLKIVVENSQGRVVYGQFSKVKPERPNGNYQQEKRCQIGGATVGLIPAAKVAKEAHL